MYAFSVAASITYAFFVAANITLCGASIGDNDPEPTATFVARVQLIEVIGKRKASAIPVGVDPRWLVEIEIISIKKSGPHFENKGKRFLAIHSPVKTFLASNEEVIGNAYLFQIYGDNINGCHKYYHATASPAAETPNESESPPNNARPQSPQGGSREDGSGSIPLIPGNLLWH